MTPPLAPELAATPADTRAAAAAAPRPPVDLPRLVVRRAAAVVAAGFVIALVLGVARMQRDVADELAGAAALARLAEVLATAASHDDAEVLDRLRALQADGALRHLRLTVRGPDGRDLVGIGAAPSAGWPWPALAAAAPPVSSWPLARPDGAAWQVTLVASPDSERREAIASGLESAALLVLLAAGVLAAVGWSVRRSLRPLRTMRRAIGRIEHEDRDSLRRLPPMPVAELESIAAALRHMAGALDAAQTHQRRLAQQVLTLQEDERQRLARELHDEFGQRLTAMRVDAAWLHKRLQGPPPADAELATVSASIGAQCERIQLDIRQLLTRLRPLDGEGEATTLQRLADLLAPLADGTRRALGGGACTVRWHAEDAAGRPVPWARVAACALPQAAALALYRISQEALTNVARHARASEATLALRVVVDAAGDGTAPRLRTIEWSVEDTGVGIADLDAALRRGNGLAGLHERVWALGGDLRCAPRAPGAARPGLALAARFELGAGGRAP